MPTIDLFAPAVLNRVVQDLKDTPPSLFFLDTFFPETSVSNQEQIFFDVLTGKPRLAPFVAPLSEGQVVHHKGYQTSSFSPAYIKDKRVFEDGRPVRRQAGQPIAAAIDPMAVRQQLLAQDTQDQIAMINRRMEWMASSILRTGSVTISGEKYPTTVVNFGRDAALTVTLSGTALWSDAGSDPVTNLETWNQLIRSKSGANAIDVVMGGNVWPYLRNKQAIRDLLDKGMGYDARTDFNAGPDGMVNGATFKGTIGDFRFWVYSESYVDDSGTTQQFMPDNYVILASRTQVEGVRHFGGIKDEAAGFQARDFFQKSWIEQDPSRRFLLMQSAPLVVPYRINATLCAKVL